MKKNLIKKSILIVVSLLTLMIISPATLVLADCSTDTTSNTICLDSLPHVDTSSSSDVIPVIMNIAFGVIGLIAVIIITLAGFSYITSSGEPEKTAKAKDTILYALIGVVVAVLGATITSFIAGYF